MQFIVYPQDSFWLTELRCSSEMRWKSCSLRWAIYVMTRGKRKLRVRRMKKKQAKTKCSLTHAGFIFSGGLCLQRNAQTGSLCWKASQTTDLTGWGKIKIAGGLCNYYISLDVHCSYWSCAKRSVARVAALICAKSFQTYDLLVGSCQTQMQEEEEVWTIIFTTFAASFIVAFLSCWVWARGNGELSGTTDGISHPPCPRSPLSDRCHAATPGTDTVRQNSLAASGWQ